MKSIRIPTLIAAVLLYVTTVGSLPAELVYTSSATAPTVDGADIANLAGGSILGGGDEANWIFGLDRPSQGQTFTTGSDPAGYDLDAVTIQRATGGTTSYSFENVTDLTYGLRIDTPSGTDLLATDLLNDTTASIAARATTSAGGNLVTDPAELDFVTLSGFSVHLDPNTTYSFDLVIPNGISQGWKLNANTDVNSYSGGNAFSTGDNGNPSDTMTVRSGDRVFHLNLTANSLPQVDADGDGIADTAETNTGIFVDAYDTGTDPLLVDSDGDGINDGAELALGFNPSNPASTPPAGSALSGLLSVGSIGPFLGGDLPPRSPSVSSGDNWQRVDAFPGLANFAQTYGIVSEPNPDPADGEQYLHVLELRGTMQRVKWDGSTTTRTTVLDIQDRVAASGFQEGGLRTVVFHPDYNIAGSPNRNFLYAFYSTIVPGNKSFRLSRFTRDETTGLIPSSSELVMIQQSVAGSNQPGAHPGGGMVFGLDGMLYIGWGDLEYIFTNPPTSHRDCQRIDRIFQSVMTRIDVDMDPAKSDPPTRTLQGNNAAHPNPMPGTSQSCPPTHPFYQASNFSGQGYYIPKDNFFKVNPPGPGDPSHAGYPHGEALAETVALGMRQPWRLALDPVDGDIVWFNIGGEASPDFEEVEHYVPGGNYGWPYREGTISATPETKLAKPPTAFSWSPIYLGTETDAIATKPHGLGGQDANGCAVGGVIYRGIKHSSLQGKVIWGDYSVGRIWAVDYKGLPVGDGSNTQLIQTSGGIMQMCASPDGEDILFVTQNGGRIYKLEDASTVAAEPPALLSATGAFTDLATLTPRAGLIPYEPAAPLWSDRALKKRWIAVPNDTGTAGQFDQNEEKITFSENDEWSFPVGTVFVKHFTLPLDEGDPNNPAKQKNLETRFLVHGDDGNYYAMTYKWRADDSDADLVPSGDTAAISESFTISRPGRPDYTQTWSYPSRTQCFDCHQSGTGIVLGMKTRQMNHPISYPTSGLSANQLTTMDHLGMFDQSVPLQELISFLKSHHISDQTASRELRVRSYLDANCAMCHRPGADSGRAVFDALLTTPLENASLIDGGVFAGALGLDGPKIIKPGDPDNSVLHYRDSSINPLETMPPIGSSLVDEDYVEVLRQWILEMGAPTESEQSGYQSLLASSNGNLWESYLQNQGAGSDPNGLFTVQPDGALHLLDIENTNDPQDFGYLGTRQSFRNYRIRFDYKLGNKTFVPRLNDPRSGGLLYHLSGSDQVWPTSLRYGIGESDVGLVEGLGGASFDSTVFSPGSNIYQVAGQPDPGRSSALLPSSSPNLVGDWNTCECIVTHNESIHLLNGIVNNRTTQLTAGGLPITEGRIAFQVMGAEMQIRNIDLKPLVSTGGGPAFRVLVFSKTAGFRHDSIDEGITAVRELGRRNNFWVDATEDAAIFNDDELAQFKVVIFMNTSDSILNATQQAVFERYIQAGGGFVGVHGAVATHHSGDWPWYGGLAGAFFASHPAQQNATVDIVDPGHPSTDSIGARWGRFDEWYNLTTNPSTNPDIRVLASVDETTYSGGSGAVNGIHPVTWCRYYDGGRSWVTTLGHTEASFVEPLFLNHLLGGIEWAAGVSSEPGPDATVLFDGSDTSAWQKLSDGSPVTWQQVGEGLEVVPGEGDIVTAEKFGDFRLHLEFRPDASFSVDEQTRGNSGVFLQGCYELQILDSYGGTLNGADDCGSIAGLADPASNESWPAGAWQHYDVWFEAARWNGPTKVRNARVTIYWNGQLVHDRLELPGSTPGGFVEAPVTGPILLEDGGSPVRFRNIWVVPNEPLPTDWVSVSDFSFDSNNNSVSLSWASSMPGPYTIEAATAENFAAGIFPITLVNDAISPANGIVIPAADAFFSQ